MQPFLDPAERLVLIRDGFYSDDEAVRQRASMVLELDRGSTYTSVARSQKCHPRTVKYWYLRYLERRSPAALRPANDPHRRYEDKANHASRARALVALAESHHGRRLPWSAAERDRVIHDARCAANPRLRYRQAILFALDRHVPTAAIARASLTRECVLTDILFRELHGIGRRALRGMEARRLKPSERNVSPQGGS